MRKQRLRDLGNWPKVIGNGTPQQTLVQTPDFSITSISQSLVQGPHMQFLLKTYCIRIPELGEEILFTLVQTPYTCCTTYAINPASCYIYSWILWQVQIYVC